MPSQGEDFITFFRQLYGVDIQLTANGSEHDECCHGIYRDSAGAVIKCTADGACGSTYWLVSRQSAQEEPEELMRCHTLNEDGRVLELRVAAYD